MARFKKLNEKQRQKIEVEVKLMLHAGRDCQRNLGVDTTFFRHDCNNPYYAEAFGIMRGLAVMGYGDLEVGDSPFRLKSWFDNLADEVLKEENFGDNNHCDFCLRHYGKDAVRITPSVLR
jgi:hypothetical protein